MPTPILVTGVAGFIGFHLARRLLTDGLQVLGIDNLNDYYDPRLKRARVKELKKQPKFHFQRCDIADRTAMAKLFAAQPFDYVVHLAAQAGVRYSLENPTVCGFKSDRLLEYIGRVPSPRLPASDLCLVVFGIRRQ